MQTFIDDEAGYLAWLATHPAGVVANVAREGPTGYCKLHEAACIWIRSRPLFTSGAYCKVCAPDRNELVEWARQTGKPTTCKVCWRGPYLGPAQTEGRPATSTSSQGPGGTPRAPAASARVWSPTPLTHGALETQRWRLWTHGTVLKDLDLDGELTPRLDPWLKTTDPAQMRVHAYLTALQAALTPLPAGNGDLYLHLEVDVGVPERLLRGGDIENYLYPVVTRLGWRHFCLVSGAKRVGGGSRLTIGHAAPREDVADSGWAHVAHTIDSRLVEKEWKVGLRAALASTRPAPLPSGPVEVQLAWRCAAGRNWVNLWKATADAMGPVLGEPDPRNPFNPADDRIIGLSLHRLDDDVAGSAIDVGMWWRPHPRP